MNTGTCSVCGHRVGHGRGECPMEDPVEVAKAQAAGLPAPFGEILKSLDRIQTAVARTTIEQHFVHAELRKLIPLIASLLPTRPIVASAAASETKP